MPLGAARLALFAKPQVTAVAEVIRAKVGVTAFGNAQVDTAQSKFGGTSAAFDGTGDYLKVDSPSFNFGTGDFTIEGWVMDNSTSNSGIFHLASTLFPASTTGLAVWARPDTTAVDWIVYSNGSTGTAIQSPDVSTNTWYHFALVRNSGTLTLYINGTSAYSESDTNSYTGTIMSIGGAYSTSFLMNGYIDDFRVSDVARYTSSFTPHTSPHVNDANTLLLLHMDGTDGSQVFEDDNGGRTQVGVGAFGNAQIDTAQSKFGGSSAYFDGTSDYMQAAAGAVSAVGTGDFTMECWFYTTDNTQNGLLMNNRKGSSGGTDNVSNWIRLLSNKVEWSDGTTAYQSTTTPANNTWHHVAVTRSSGNMTLWLNGTSENTWTFSTELTGPRYFSMGEFENGVGAADFVGWIDEVRYSSVARYTTSFTPSTTPFVNDADTLLLLHMDGTDGSTYIPDDNGKGRTPIGVSALGNTQVDTAQSKFGGASALFDGTGDYLKFTLPDQGTDNWTVEAWVRNDGSWAGQNHCVWADAGNAQGFIDSSGRIAYYRGGTTTGTTTLGNNTWYHVAWVYEGGAVNMYIDGTYETQRLETGSFGGTSYIGVNINANGAYWDGHIDEWRWSSTARYTTGFTAPTAPFQNDANTLLLLHMDGTDASQDFSDDNGVY